MKVTVEISDQFLSDQFLSAQIGYWAKSADEGSAVVERETNKKFRLDWKRAARLAVAKHPRILDPDNMDASTGDVWVQLAAFGEVRYG